MPKVKGKIFTNGVITTIAPSNSLGHFFRPPWHAVVKI